MGNKKEMGILVLVDVTDSDCQEEIRLTEREIQMGLQVFYHVILYSTKSSSNN